jgi:hypothetical protein
MVISPIDIVEVNDARKSRIKNSVDQNKPPGIFTKIDGSTSKTSLGPAVGCKP